MSDDPGQEKRKPARLVQLQGSGRHRTARLSLTAVDADAHLKFEIVFQLAAHPVLRHTTFVRSGRSGRPRETKGVTVTAPLLTGCEIRALKRPEASSV